MGTIAGILNQCLNDFTAFTTSSALTRYETEVPHHRWLDELGRLRIWSGNIGAHKVGQSSLDYRLRDSSHLKNETIKLLGRLSRVIQDLTVVINEEEDDEENYEIELESDEDEDEPMTEVQQLYQSLVDVINLMFQISMAIRRPADHDRLIGMKVKNESYFQPWARQHVSHKYPDAEGETIGRLSTAMARQKAILKYRERHRAKLGQGLPGVFDTKSTKFSETVATELPPEDQLQFLETSSNSGLSQTSYATSLMAAQDRISVPNPPKESADNAPFECPYCFHLVTIKHQRDWARHVFRDLMPYVCLSGDCPTPSKLYESRSQWYFHMRDLHPDITNANTGSICPLCQTGVTPPLTFEKHVSRHLEELALFVLPRTDVGDEESAELSSEAKLDEGARRNSLSVGEDSGDGSEPELEDKSEDPGRDRRDRLWTEITKDLVVREAIERAGYEYEETELYYYIFQYLEHDHLDALVRDSENIRNERRRWIQESRHERASLPPHMNDGGDGMSSGDGGAVPFLAGDWKCGLEGCGYHNFAKNISCLRCGDPRSEAAVIADSAFPSPMESREKSSEEVRDARRRRIQEILRERESSKKSPMPPEKSSVDIPPYYTPYLHTNPSEKFEQDNSERHVYRRSSLAERVEPAPARSDPANVDSDSDESNQHRAFPVPGKQVMVSGRRSENGCLTCSLRKKKCDETKPACSTCITGGFLCEGYPSKGNGHPEGLAQRSPSGSHSRERANEQGNPEPSPLDEATAAPIGILKPPRAKSPEDPNPIGEAAAPRKGDPNGGIPPGARWTKIDRRIVNPAALEAGGERFEEREECVVVRRVLTRDEIQAYAVKTQEIRDARYQGYVESSDRPRRLDRFEVRDRLQDDVLSSQQQEIDRLERELARHRSGQYETRPLEEEEDYEVEISDRLGRLRRFEEKGGLEKELRKAKRRYKLHPLEESYILEQEREESQK